jgi:coenzyme F420-reducing hydrogenase delta subunit
VEGTDSKILAFICSHCSLSGAETAGVNKLQYSTDMRIIQTACSGQVDETLIVNAFKKGADAVIVFACPDGDCHYKVGNHIAKQRIKELQVALKAVGLGEKRLKLVQIGASEGEKFVEAINQTFKELKELGLSPIAKRKE